jgi:hypothetical protein
MDTADLDASPSDFFPCEIDGNGAATMGGREFTRENGGRFA